ncbi:hypothetical protein ACFZAH_21175 [Streptomyces lavendulae]|uniref:hypothetical protein n=1 Tax=Streptomyces lavendulae TaxID=1914 RepID=UPI0036EFB717
MSSGFARAGKKAFDKRLPDTELKLRELLGELRAKHGTALVVVDRPVSTGALSPSSARVMVCPVSGLPGLTMSRIAAKRLHGPLAQIRPSLERVRGPRS